ncbi:hypothetical protein LT679_17715 [Mucilaginibacter roseus]|uniref:MalT-like TPR region domain-containing protein n=1 Tax=Mucilaginibacter roseus TaxID=1528868 RepID=A0ABS8U7R4_9SPHI|nr:hypothetical protein [Mucilaginibacter roseus]MCD8742452.1 hypothetical protein [Mucilaginibacter roseus]
MKYFLFLFLCFTGLSASAQWWRIGPLKHKRYPQIAPVKNYVFNKNYILGSSQVKPVPIKPVKLRSYYDLTQAENRFMKSAQHNMRFREYNIASYNFSDLAKVYMELNRLSEAKWFLLQSNRISRLQNDDRHTFLNLISLASVKIDMGDVSLAREDLIEARGIANARGWRNESAEVDKKIQSIKNVSNSAPKAELKYADMPAAETKSK